ncbi:hypothetical protein GSI_14516 [Ganoderma sinense ZZ0214-1]|uniref:Uncharacterized protein n=1 Tax=Ganoderma sinense ZZ0214-1 TaxID=1077348 RepID=A0A2G8RNX9_9APHY|nr:hypothetical protein GSI_14516 [Ganoderma sinense ZZ0214-1]
MPLPSHEEETYMLLPSQASARLPIVPTQFPNVYATQPASVFDGPVVVMPVSHYLGLLGMSGTSPVGPPPALPAASPHQYSSTTSAQPSATLAADPRASHSTRQPTAELTTPIDEHATSPSPRRKVNIACNNCHESRKPRKRRAQPPRKPTGSNIAPSSSTASSLNVSLPRPAAQQHMPLGSSSMLSFLPSTAHHLNSSATNESVFDSSYFYSTL